MKKIAISFCCIVLLTGAVLAQDSGDMPIGGDVGSSQSPVASVTQKPDTKNTRITQVPPTQKAPITPTLYPIRNSETSKDAIKNHITPIPGRNASEPAKLIYIYRNTESFTKELVAADQQGKLKTEQLKVQWNATRVQYLQKIQTVKDEKKKAIVQKVDENLNTINANQVQKMKSALDQMQKVMNSLTEAITKLKAGGADTTNAENAILAAQNALTAAQSALTIQSEKIYAPTITSDTELRKDVLTEVNSLRTDLLVVQKLLLSARESLMKAIVELRKLKPVTPTIIISPVAPTSTASPTATLNQ